MWRRIARKAAAGTAAAVVGTAAIVRHARKRASPETVIQTR